MTKEKTDVNDYYKNKYKRMGCAIYLIPILAFPILADEIKFQFKSPSFSGVGTSQHYLTIDEQEYTRKQVKKKKKAKKKMKIKKKKVKNK